MSLTWEGGECFPIRCWILLCFWIRKDISLTETGVGQQAFPTKLEVSGKKALHTHSTLVKWSGKIFENSAKSG